MDSKTPYSNASKRFVSIDISNNPVLMKMYKRSKEREERYGKYWNENKVNINDIVDRFIDISQMNTYIAGTKFIYQDDNYSVVCDMSSGYLRIYDRKSSSPVMLDGTPSDNDKFTHLKILTREEMK